MKTVENADFMMDPFFFLERAETLFWDLFDVTAIADGMVADVNQVFLSCITPWFH